MPKICFATNEIAPLTPGGAGTLISNLTRELLHEQIEVILLLDVDKNVFDDFQNKEHSLYPNNYLLKTYQLDSLCNTIPFSRNKFNSRYLWESYRYHWGLLQIDEIDHPDVVEFVDFCGPAYYSLCCKLFGVHHQETQIAIRIHGPITIIDQYTAGKPLDFDRYCIYALEKQSIKLADVILYPSSTILEKIAMDFEPWRGTTFCSPPPVQRNFDHAQKDVDANIVLFYSRLYKEKGADNFIKAAIQLLDSTKSSLSFFLIGSDSEPPNGTYYSSYSEYLRGMVPRRFSDRFKFTGHLSQKQVNDILPYVKFAAFPSTFETFGYAAQEIHQSGTPIIVSSIPVFQDEFNGVPNVFFFDGTVRDLAEKMASLDSTIFNPTTIPPAATKEKDDPLSFYRAAQNPVHPRESKGSVSKVLVIILEDSWNKDDFRRTEEGLLNLDPEIYSIIHLQKIEKYQENDQGVSLLGNLYSIIKASSEIIETSDLVSKDAMILLQAGDEIQIDFLIKGVSAFNNDPNLGYIHCWAEIVNGKKQWLHNHPVAAMPEMVPFETVSDHLCVFFRTRANVRLEELFDQQTGKLGECNLLWSENAAGRFGIDIPKVYLKQNFEPTNNKGDPVLTYLLNKYSRTGMATSLVGYLTLMTNGFPKRQFPLQHQWERKSGLPFGREKKQDFNIFSGNNLKDKVFSQLASGSTMQRQLLKFLRKIARLIRALGQKR